MISPIPTLLLVEDFGPDRELYRRYLLADENTPYRLLEAGTARAGLDLCRTEAIAAILLDYRLPDADGLEFLDRLHAQSNDHSPPVVMVTGEGDERVAVQAIKRGAEDYLVKQRLTPELLQVTVQGAIANAQLRQQLRNQEERFRISLDTMLDCFGLCTAIRDEAGQIQDFRLDHLNRAALESAQMTVADLGRWLWEMFPFQRETGLFQDYCQVVETGEPLMREELIYADRGGDRVLTRAYDIRASKLQDGLVICWREISDRKRLELELSQRLGELQQQQHRLQRLIETAPIGIGIGTADGRVSVINDEMLRLHGCTRQEFEQQGLNWRDFTPPELRCRSDPAMAKLRQQGRLLPEEKELLWRDGTRLPVWISAVQWQDGTDEHVAFAVDLTQQKQAEQELRQRERTIQQQLAELENIYSTAPVGLCVVDLDLRYVRINERLAQINGAPVADHLGRTIRELLPDLADRVEALHRQVAATGEPILDREVSGITPAQPGVERIWNSSYLPLRDASGQLLGINVMAQDITERRRVEQFLQESEQRLRLGVQVAGIALARVDYASGRVLLSPEAAVLYGITDSPTAAQFWVVTRDRIHASFHPDERDELEQIIQQVLDPAGAGWFAREHRVVWPDGQVRWLNVRKQVFFDRSAATDQPDYAILAAIDVTERKQSEAEREHLLQQAQAARAQAETANRSKDDFVSLVAHELRSPLNAILGWAKLLQSRPLDAATTQKALQTIAQNAESQAQLIEDLMDVSRMVRGSLRMTLSPITLAAVLEAAVEAIRPSVAAQNQDLDLQIYAVAPVNGDFQRLQQVLLNLLTNAIKFTPAGGRITVQLSASLHSAQLQVSDTGKGIHPDLLPHIFERFHQDPHNTTTKQGLGLGLAIAQYIVHQHNGTLTAKSAGEGQGATFTITLPLKSTHDP